VTTEPLTERAEAGDAAVQRLRDLQAITEAALSHLGLDELLEVLLTRLREILAADTAAVLLLDTDAGELVARAAKGLEEEVERRVRIPLGAGFAGTIAAERTPRFLADVTPDSVVNPILIEKGVRSMLGVPLLVDERILGVVHVGTLTRREFSAADTELLELAAARMALAIDHARLYEAEREARKLAEQSAERVHKIEAITDVALGHFSLDEALLNGILDRVRQALATDTAAILLLDPAAEELVARAAKGLEEEVERGVRIPVGGGFAGRIAAERRPVFLPNVDHDKVLNPILLEKGIRSLLGVPLMVEGRVLGVLHVGTLTPRAFTAEDTSLLELAADRIAVAIDRARQHSVAATLQRSLLPARLPALGGLETAARYLPAADDAHVGGDWYDVIELPQGRVGLVMGDVVSRGVRAATAMGHLRTALRAYAIDGSPPATVLRRLNELTRTMDEREMATVAYAVLDPDSGELTYALAGHPPPLVVPADGEGRFLDGGRAGPVGVATPGTYREATATIEPGDTLLLYTDGLVERPDLSLDDGLAALRDRASATAATADALCGGLVQDLDSSPDDVAVLALRLGPQPSDRLQLTVPAVPGALAEMRRSLAAWLVAAGAGQEDAYDVILAVGEAAANAVEHAYGPVEADFELAAEARDGEAHLTVTDQGNWRPARGHNRGRGIALMRELMDHVDVDLCDAGTAVRMSRRLRREDGA
jgi:GAF domain-containing protein/anti-sigma regulatory factor (Ser/Thr protein kinase)